MSPVSPTFVTPLASSSMRLGSPSKDTIGNDPAGESVRSTTNSCVSVPELVTMNETGPCVAYGRDRSMNMWVASVSPRPTVIGWSADEYPCGVAAAVPPPAL